MSSVDQKTIVLYIISQFGNVRHDNLFDILFLAHSNGLVKYIFENESSVVVFSANLRKDVADLLSKSLISEELEKVSEDFGESTHVYKITEYGCVIASKLKEQAPTFSVKLDQFLSKYKGMSPLQLEQEANEARNK
jgi:predicted transcriptional regulator